MVMSSGQFGYALDSFFGYADRRALARVKVLKETQKQNPVKRGMAKRKRSTREYYKRHGVCKPYMPPRHAIKFCCWVDDRDPVQEVFDPRRPFVFLGSVDRVLSAETIVFDLEDWDDADFARLPDGEELPLKTRQRIAAQRPKWKVRETEEVESHDGQGKITVKTHRLIPVEKKPRGRQPDQSWKERRFAQHVPERVEQDVDGRIMRTEMRACKGARSWRVNNKDIYDFNRELDLREVGLRTLFMSWEDGEDFWAMVEDPEWVKWRRREARARNGGQPDMWNDEGFLNSCPLINWEERWDRHNSWAISALNRTRWNFEHLVEAWDTYFDRFPISTEPKDQETFENECYNRLFDYCDRIDAIEFYEENGFDRPVEAEDWDDLYDDKYDDMFDFNHDREEEEEWDHPPLPEW